MRVVAIIQARMGSSRLPGKVMRKVLGKPLIAYQLERVRRAANIDEIMIATTTEKNDDPIVTFCEEEKVPYYRGSEHDVLSRYYHAARSAGANVIVRLTSDCPLIDPAVIEKIAGAYSGSSAYVSNVVKRTFPRGMDVEVFSMELLEMMYHEATSERDREHVTTFIREQPDRFQLCDITNGTDYSKYRLTVDTIEDFTVIRKIIEYLYPSNPSFTLDDVINLLNRHPDLLKINAHIEQKR
ncbi:spore coat polysaccharide biosynthesis protein SpsF [Gracilibacillus ureilyticus]|uniref:Spore coat polysaccharide biosynthesis protein SpsF n=1 Tax=Gracilibacillus ureilyticus TaxID=531814 RepID=A0A1H9RW13_9BACI|nr:glycosyltransferase family protein [Gracilibacillus ureilyticus]SER76099.1 spore coat polysaccharide biosynthesis protein SpsF [Gracilibacillus ureilyticus]